MERESYGSLFSKHLLDSWIKQGTLYEIFRSVSRTQWAAIALGCLMLILLFQKTQGVPNKSGFLKLPYEIELKQTCNGRNKISGQLIYKGVENCLAIKDIDLNCQDSSIILSDENLIKMSRIIKRKMKRFIFTTLRSGEISECEKIKKIIYEVF